MDKIIFSKETWEFINTFSPWLSAIGTLAAVLVSLYLSGQDRRIKLRISAHSSFLISQGLPGKPTEYLSIHIVNTGRREVQIINIGWKVGLFKKQYAVQTIMRDGISSTLPVRIRDGEEANYFIPLKDSSWLKDFVEKFLHPDPESRLKHLKIQAVTSVGKKFESKIDKSLQTELLNYIHGKKTP
jgi:hypothetical protein